MYAENIPRVDTLQKFVASNCTFPDNAQHLADRAGELGYDQDIIAFLHLFSPERVFSSPQEFIRRCQELELKIYR